MAGGPNPLYEQVDQTGNTNALKYQQAQINNYSANMPAYQQSQFAGIEDSAKSGLQSDNAQIDQNYNSRGLLYSGLKDQSKANATSARAGQAAGEEAQANYNINEQNYVNKQQGINSGINNLQGQNAFYIGQEQQNQQTDAQNNSGAAMLGGGLIGGIGAIAAFDKGGRVPGKPIVKGDSPVNDTVLILASPEETILPRSVSKNPDKAKDYVKKLNADGGDVEKYDKDSKSDALSNILASQAFIHKKKQYFGKKESA